MLGRIGLLSPQTEERRSGGRTMWLLVITRSVTMWKDVDMASKLLCCLTLSPRQNWSYKQCCPYQDSFLFTVKALWIDSHRQTQRCVSMVILNPVMWIMKITHHVVYEWHHLRRWKAVCPPHTLVCMEVFSSTCKAHFCFGLPNRAMV